MGKKINLQPANSKGPNDETPIWRYMDLPKFVSTLANHALWFTRAAELRDDPYEGFWRIKPIDIPPLDQGKERFTFKDENGRDMEISVECAIACVRDFYSSTCQKARDYLYVNSWCHGQGQSMAMWRIYSSMEYGVAVKSSIAGYRSALRSNLLPNCHAFGKVYYHGDIESSREVLRDFSKGRIPSDNTISQEILKLGFHKRSCYKHENEWRAAICRQEKGSENGCYIDFDLEQLITAIYVSPRAEEFFFNAVSSIMDKFSLKKPLLKSDLLRNP